MTKFQKIELFLDLDNCLYPFAENAVRHYNIDFHDNVNPNSIKDYWFAECKKAPKQYFDLLFHKKDFFNEMPPSGINVDYFNLFLDEGYEIYIVTSPVRNYYCYLEKQEWLHTYFPRFDLDNFIACDCKWKLAQENGILWDDNLKYLNKWHECGGISVCCKKGWSEEWCGLEASNMKELYDLVKRIEKQKN